MNLTVKSFLRFLFVVILLCCAATENIRARTITRTETVAVEDFAGYKTEIVIEQSDGMPAEFKQYILAEISEKIKTIKNVSLTGRETISFNNKYSSSLSAALSAAKKSGAQRLVYARARYIESIRRRVVGNDGEGQYLIEKIKHRSIELSIVLYDVNERKVLAEFSKSSELSRLPLSAIVDEYAHRIKPLYPDVFITIETEIELQCEKSYFVAASSAFTYGKFNHISSNRYGIDGGVKIRGLFYEWDELYVRSGLYYGTSDNPLINYYLAVPLSVGAGRVFTPLRWLSLVPSVSVGYFSHLVVSDLGTDIYFDPLLTVGVEAAVPIDENSRFFIRCDGDLIFEKNGCGKFISVCAGMNRRLF